MTPTVLLFWTCFASHPSCDIREDFSNFIVKPYDSVTECESDVKNFVTSHKPPKGILVRYVCVRKDLML